MTNKKTIPGYTRIKGKSERYLVEATGETISRRHYDEKIKNIGQLTYEEKAKLNAKLNPIAQALRPAKGRKSALKVGKDLETIVGQARLESIKEKKEREQKELEEKRAERKRQHQIEAAKRKKVKVKKITMRLLKPGDMGRRISFNDYDDYLDLYKQSEKSGKLFAYGIGLEGVDIRTGKVLTPTLWNLRGFDSPISEDDFFERVQDYLENTAYFLMSNYYIHLAFKSELAKAKKENAKQDKLKKTGIVDSGSSKPTGKRTSKKTKTKN